MTYGYTTVKCPRCGSTIEIVNRSVPNGVFLCPVCADGEICHQSRYQEPLPGLQPALVGAPESRGMERYIVTLSNIWTN